MTLLVAAGITALETRKPDFRGKLPVRGRSTTGVPHTTTQIPCLELHIAIAIELLRTIEIAVADQSHRVEPGQSTFPARLVHDEGGTAFTSATQTTGTGEDIMTGLWKRQRFPAETAADLHPLQTGDAFLDPSLSILLQ